MKVYFYRNSYAMLYTKMLIDIHTEHCRCNDNICKNGCRVDGWSIRIGRFKMIIERRRPKGCKAPF